MALHQKLRREKQEKNSLTSYVKMRECYGFLDMFRFIELFPFESSYIRIFFWLKPLSFIFYINSLDYDSLEILIDNKTRKSLFIWHQYNCYWTWRSIRSFYFSLAIYCDIKFFYVVTLQVIWLYLIKWDRAFWIFLKEMPVSALKVVPVVVLGTALCSF